MEDNLRIANLAETVTQNSHVSRSRLHYKMNTPEQFNEVRFFLHPLGSPVSLSEKPCIDCFCIFCFLD